MTKKYMLLTPLKGSDFSITNVALIKALKEHDCGHEITFLPDDTSVIYATASSPEILGEMCTRNDIAGLVIEYTGIYDQSVEVIQ